MEYNSEIIDLYLVDIQSGYQLPYNTNTMHTIYQNSIQYIQI